MKRNLRAWCPLPRNASKTKRSLIHTHAHVWFGSITMSTEPSFLPNLSKRHRETVNTQAITITIETPPTNPSNFPPSYKTPLIHKRSAPWNSEPEREKVVVVSRPENGQQRKGPDSSGSGSRWRGSHHHHQPTCQFPLNRWYFSSLQV